ncbi:MAG: hypothetical protein IPM98_12200 [Lewinellaceae bacterium]|nr:hypothetical protein [Lewinellaceae bacterium]
MHWRFDPLFTIEVYHSKYKTPDPDTGELPRKAPDFALEPSVSTAGHLLRMGWVFRSQAGGGTVYGEKVFAADGTAALRSLPTPDEGFTFLLRLKNPALLNETKPYVLESKPVLKPNPNLPAFSGRFRLLYFDNRDPVPRPGGELWLTPTPVGVAQFGSAAPAPFTLSCSKTDASEVAFTPLAPAGAVQSFPVDTKTKTVRIDLPENGYQLLHKPGNQAEVLFLTTDLPTGDVLGVVRIFKPSGTAGWEPHRRYQIIFEEA